MPGMLGIIDSHHMDYDKQLLSESIDLLSLHKAKTINFQGGFVSVSSLQRSPLKGERWVEQEDKIFCFSGDLADLPELPWKEIINAIKQKKYEKFKDYQGIFAITCIDKKNKQVTIVSDRRAQHPIYYKTLERGFVFSTELSTFCRFNEQAQFNRNWLYEYFFFNFPVGETTFIKKVNRMPPATVLEFDYHKLKVSFTTYDDIFRRKTKLLEGDEGFKKATDIFHERIPQYFKGADEVACALTDGWDGRTMIALAPDIAKVVSYTYGVPGCEDVKGGSRTARLAKIKHKKILFNDEFTRKFPSYMAKTIFMTSGIQSIARCTLLYAYEQLTDSGKNFPLIISGISLDQLFRSPISIPMPISKDIAEIFRTGKLVFRKDFWDFVFKEKLDDFYEKISSKINLLKELFGEYKSSEHHLLYKLYVQAPHYFGGELKIAENYSTLRVPSWDTHIIDLAFSIKESALSFSTFEKRRGSSQSAFELQSYILTKLSPRFSKIRVRNTRPDIILKHNLYYKGYMLYRLILNKANYFLNGKAPLEDWHKWLSIEHKNFIDELIFSKNSLINEYISKEFRNKIQSNRDTYWIGKLATVEIILRLMKSRWMSYDDIIPSP